MKIHFLYLALVSVLLSGCPATTGNFSEATLTKGKWYLHVNWECDCVESVAIAVFSSGGTFSLSPIQYDTIADGVPCAKTDPVPGSQETALNLLWDEAIQSLSSEPTKAGANTWWLEGGAVHMLVSGACSNEYVFAAPSTFSNFVDDCGLPNGCARLARN